MQGSPHKATDGTREQVKLWSAAGLTQVRIAAMFGINDKTFRKHYTQEYDGGVDEMVGELFKVSYGVAVDPEHKDSSKERQFLLKTRGGYSEQQKIEHSGGVDLKGFTVEFVSADDNAKD